MSRSPLVSVCIANYEGIGLIDACLRSVLEQEEGAAVEIIVHDDASRDGSVAHIRTHYPQVRLIESAQNVGFCIANNRMAAVARGEFLLLLNNDAELFPDGVRTLLAEARSLCRPAILTLPQYNAGTGELLDMGCLLDPFFNPVPNRNPARGNVGTVHGACLWLPKALWEEIGGFPVWFDSVGEDLYLCCRARLAGYPVRALATSGYRHRVGASFGGGKVSGGRLRSSVRRRALTERNKTFVMIITLPMFWACLLLPLHFFLLVVEGMLLSLLNRRLALLREIYLPVFGALLRRRQELGAERRKAMMSRHVSRLDFFTVFDWVPYKLRMLLRYGLPRVD
ncbi:MAG: glycosyltransferase family 2 protein [Sulfuricellaceae bacterium]